MSAYTNDIDTTDAVSAMKRLSESMLKFQQSIISTYAPIAEAMNYKQTVGEKISSATIRVTDLVCGVVYHVVHSIVYVPLRLVYSVTHGVFDAVLLAFNADTCYGDDQDTSEKYI